MATNHTAFEIIAKLCTQLDKLDPESVEYAIGGEVLVVYMGDGDPDPQRIRALWEVVAIADMPPTIKAAFLATRDALAAIDVNPPAPHN